MISSLVVLIVLIFSKYFYLASMSSYYTFFLMEKFGLSIKSAQLHLFGFLFAVAAGTFLGGPIGDRIGRKAVIWVSILGVAPFALALPYANLFWAGVLTAIIGLILSSAFSAILVYAQELIPGKVGLMAGLLLWSRLWDGRHRLRCSRGAGRLARNRVRLSHLLLPAAHRIAHRVAAESGEKRSRDCLITRPCAEM